jgi:hypothetical protein
MTAARQYSTVALSTLALASVQILLFTWLAGLIN